MFGNKEKIQEENKEVSVKASGPILQKLGIKICLLDHLSIKLQTDINIQNKSDLLCSGQETRAWKSLIRKQIRQNFQDRDNFLKNILFSIENQDQFKLLQTLILLSLYCKFENSGNQGIISDFLKLNKVSQETQDQAQFLRNLQKTNDHFLFEILTSDFEFDLDFQEFENILNFKTQNQDQAVNNLEKLQNLKKSCSQNIKHGQVNKIVQKIKKNKSIKENLKNALRCNRYQPLEAPIFRHVLWTLTLSSMPGEVQMFLQNQDAVGSLLDPKNHRKNIAILKILFQIFSIQNQPLLAYQYLIRFKDSFDFLEFEQVSDIFFVEEDSNTQNLIAKASVRANRGLVVKALALFFGFRGNAISLFQLKLMAEDENILQKFLSCQLKNVEALRDFQSPIYDQGTFIIG